MKKKLEFKKPAEAFAREAQFQKAYAGAIAIKIERGEPLTEVERLWAVGALRAFAEQIPIEPSGHKHKIDPHSTAMEFLLLRQFQEMSVNMALETLAERYDVSVPAVRKSIGLKKKKPTEKLVTRGR